MLHETLVNFASALPKGEAVIHFNSDGEARLFWGGNAPKDGIAQEMSAGNLAATYSYIKILKGDALANAFIQSTCGTGQEVMH